MDETNQTNLQLSEPVVTPEPVAITPVVSDAVTTPQVEPEAPVKFVPPPPDLPVMNLAEIDINSIKPNPWQPRKTFDETALSELTESIREHGILQPLVVVPLPEGGYQLIVGERRLRASKLAGLTRVPVLIRDFMEEQKKLELALIENIQRHNLDPIEEAQAYKQLADEYNLTQEQVAQKVGKARSTVTNMLRLLTLPLKIQNAIAQGVITEGHARPILRLMGMEKQLALFELIVGQNMSVRQVEEIIREMLDAPRQVRATRNETDPEVMAMESELRGKLGTKVRVQKKGDSGKITIEFFSQEELSAFMDKVHKLEQ